MNGNESREKPKVKKKMMRITMEVKKEIVEKYEAGMRIRDLAVSYHMPRTTVFTIVKKRETIKAANVAKGVKSITKQRSNTLELVEKLLLIWITEKQCSGENVTETIICEKAKLMHAELLKKQPENNQENEGFKASHGWFSNFKKRTGIQNVVRSAGGANPDKDSEKDFVKEFEAFVKTEGFAPQQVFNCDETSLFWKRMPKRTHITQEEMALPGHKPMKDKLTLLLCSNASGDCKITPLVVYHSETPRAFKKHKIDSTTLPVIWRFNSNARLTTEYFIQWLKSAFGPSVKSYLEDNNLPLKALLVLDKSSGHPLRMKDYMLPDFDFLTIKFLPPDITRSVQPMNQGIVTNFKELYFNAVFNKSFEMTLNKKFTLREYWKNQFNIASCITLIDKAWNEVSSDTINSAWKNLWSQAVTEKSEETSKSESVVAEIVSIAKSLNLEINEDDVQELLEERKEELTIDELLELDMENNNFTTSKPLSPKRDDPEEPSTSLIQEILAKWTDVKHFAEKYHPNKAQTNLNIIVWNNQTMSHFRNILKKRERQNFFENPKTDTNTEKKEKLQKQTPTEYVMPQVLLKGNSPALSPRKKFRITKPKPGKKILNG